MPRIDLPPALAGQAFSVAEAAKTGLREGRLRGPDLSRPLHGVRSDGTLDEVAGLARAAALVLPDDVAFSHCTAAALLALPLPRGREHLDPLHVMRDSRRSRIDRPQCQPHRGLESRGIEVVRGLRVVGLADTWCDMGELLGLDDLIILGDQVARRLDSTEPLADTLAQRVRPRGKRTLLEALKWIRVGSYSPMETRCRLLFVRSGLPEPALNQEILDEWGGFVCLSDFVWERGKDKAEVRVIGEYQGGDHFKSYKRGDDDISRRLLAEDDLWKYIEITKDDYYRPSRRHAMLRRLGRYLGVEVVPDRGSRARERRFPTPSTVCRGAGSGGRAGEGLGRSGSGVSAGRSR